METLKDKEKIKHVCIKISSERKKIKPPKASFMLSFRSLTLYFISSEIVVDIEKNNGPISQKAV